MTNYINFGLSLFNVILTIYIVRYWFKNNYLLHFKHFNPIMTYCFEFILLVYFTFTLKIVLYPNTSASELGVAKATGHVGLIIVILVFFIIWEFFQVLKTRSHLKLNFTGTIILWFVLFTSFSISLGFAVYLFQTNSVSTEYIFLSFLLATMVHIDILLLNIWLYIQVQMVIDSNILVKKSISAIIKKRYKSYGILILTVLINRIFHLISSLIIEILMVIFFLVVNLSLLKWFRKIYIPYNRKLDPFLAGYDYLNSVKVKYKIDIKGLVMLDLLLKGKKDKEIAEIIKISESSVKKRIYRLYKKSGIRKRTVFIQHLRELIDRN